MALLDVSEVLTDPLFTTRVELVSCELSYDEYGQAVYRERFRRRVDAVVTSADSRYSRLPDELRKEGSIVVRFVPQKHVCRCARDFRVMGYSKVIYQERPYYIDAVLDSGQWGRGMIRLVCSVGDSYA